MSGLAARKERPEPKALGAFYTEESVAHRLVEWAIRSPEATVLDPSCGDGAFLVAAADRLSRLGSFSFRLLGVDVSEDALGESGQRVRNARLILKDFFDIAPRSLPAFDCVVGNPPYIRYQTFNGDSTSKAHERAKEAGVQLPRLASSWAPFLVHATQFLRRGGRLAMVVPSELGHAMYAREVLKFLIERFKAVEIEMFGTSFSAGWAKAPSCCSVRGTGRDATSSTSHPPTISQVIRKRKEESISERLKMADFG